jgi:hypothetical protein
MLASCETQPDNNNSETNTNDNNQQNYATITFVNETQFYVNVHRDFFSGPVILALLPGKSGTVEAPPSDNYGFGSTFSITYDFNIAEEDDSYSGKVFAVSNYVPDAQISFYVEKGETYTKQIPIPEGITFNAAYIRIKNDTDSHFELSQFSRSFKQAGNDEISVPAGETGIYSFTENDIPNLSFNDMRLQSVFQEFGITGFQMQKGWIYDLCFTETDIHPKIIQDVKWKITPEPTNTWKKGISNYTAGNFTNPNSNLNKYLTSIHRYGISHWRSHYPVNKLLYSDNTLICGEWSFGVIPVIIQNTGIAEAYEIPCITAKDTNWENSVFPARNIYAGTTSAAWQTVFNDIIRINKNYVVLSTYSKDLRTGILLSFLNEQGQIIDSFDIPADSNLESLTGVKLVNVDNNAFLVLGDKKVYTSPGDEHFTASSSIIYKYQYGNKTEIWSNEYNHSGNPINTSICGLNVNDNYIVCCYTGNDTATRTIILKINKTDGTITEIQNFGAASESWRPFSISSDISGNIYITGIATEGATSKAYIVKLDPSFNQVWLNKYGNYYDNFLFDLNITDNLLTAIGSVNNGSVYNPSFYGWQGGKGWIIRIDTETGLVIKEVFYNSVSTLNSIVRLDDGGFALAAVKSIDNTKPYWFDTFTIKINEHLIFGE